LLKLKAPRAVLINFLQPYITVLANSGALGTACTLPCIAQASKLANLAAAVSYGRESLLKGRLSAVELLVLTSLDQLLFILKILFTFFTKQATLMRRSTVLSLPLQLVFPGWGCKIVITFAPCGRQKSLTFAAIWSS
jgi:hypothetical protein